MPTSYEFKRDGQSTVSFSGQTTRLLQAVEIYNALKDTDKTEAEIKKMFNDGEGFSEAALNGTGKKLGNKIEFRTIVLVSFILHILANFLASHLNYLLL